MPDANPDPRSVASELLRLGKEATPGQWTMWRDNRIGGSYLVQYDTDETSAVVAAEAEPEDARYIAYANPENVAALASAYLSTLSALEEARKDTARLDWMGEHYARFKCSAWNGGRVVGDENVTIAWTDFDVDEETALSYEERETTGRPDFRNAIDRAMRGEFNSTGYNSIWDDPPATASTTEAPHAD